ncbi:MAG TPA: AAA family ATPase [Polyangiaceae bacterium]|nr:AAA family ATPase [Polyangiaceae bacterium]
MTCLLIDNPNDPSEQRRYLEGFRVHYDTDDGNSESLPVSVLPGPKRFNVLVGPNNSGKSRLMRQIFSQRTLMLSGQEARHRIRGLFYIKEKGSQLLDDHVFAKANSQAGIHLSDFIRQLKVFFDEPTSSASKLPPNGTGIVIKNNNEIELSLGFGLTKGVDSSTSDESAQRTRDFYYDILKHLGYSADLSEFRSHKESGRQGLDRVAKLFSLEVIEAKTYSPPVRTNLRLVDTIQLSAQASSRGWEPTCDVEPLAGAFCQSFGWSPRDHTWFLPGQRTIFTGARLYEQVEAMHKMARDTRIAWRKGVSYILDRLLGIKNAELIASDFVNQIGGKHDSPVRHVRVATETADYSIHDLGDGVFASLVMLMPLFLSWNQRRMFFIEEPETHLHPGLQREFVETLCDADFGRADHIIYISTHSPIILDALAERARGDLSILRVDKAEGAPGVSSRHTIRQLPGPTVETLERIGATANALLARSMILVEGPSDVRYVRSLIELEASSHHGELGSQETRVLAPIEGRDYAIFTYGGSLLGDLLKRGGDGVDPNSLPSLGHYILVLADEDMGKESRHNDFRRIVAPYGGRFRYVTTGEAIEVENLFDAGVWRKLFPQVHSEKWKTPKRDFDDALLARVRLGSVADHVYEGMELCPEGGKTLKPGEKTAAAAKFADLVRAKDISWNDIGPRAQAFARAIREFLDFVMNKSRAQRPSLTRSQGVLRAQR